MKHEPLTEGQYYHIYNRGNDGRVLFPEILYYEHFLFLYDLYINSVADTYAWVLMGNHFHLVISIKENLVYRYPMRELMTKKQSEAYKYKKWQAVDASSDEAPDEKMKPVPGHHFAHLFNSYSRYHQNRYGRTGNLFERPFKRKVIDNEYYFRQAILYVHQNPVHHGFCSHPADYPWSSYINHISEKPTWVQREPVKQVFGSNKNYEEAHNKLVEKEEMDIWLDINEDNTWERAANDYFDMEGKGEK